MGVGYAPNSSHVMRWDDVCAIVPDAAKALEDALGDNTIEQFCKAFRLEDYDELESGDTDDTVFDDRIEHAWNTLADAFEVATTTNGAGLFIEPGYHDPDDGDRYDDDVVNGGFFYVDGVTAITPAGKRFEEHVQWAMWLEFG